MCIFSNMLLRVRTHGDTRVVQAATIDSHDFCSDIGCRLKDSPSAMVDRDQ